MKILLFSLFFVCSLAHAAMTDIKFGRSQIADSQWNVNACLNTNTCQIYSKNPGIAYRIPWTNGQLSWATGDYVQFSLSGNSSFPYLATQYNSNGTVKSVMGTGKIVNMGPDFFFFVGNDNNTGQLFSGSSGMVGSGGVTWTGTRNPTIAQADTYADNNYSTTPLSAGQTAAPAAPAAPSLCCGGSAAQFNADTTNTAKVQTFINRTTADTQVFVEQIGDFNTTTINQTGTKNNYAWSKSTGSSNTTTIIQSGNASTVANYAGVGITGNNNSVAVTQTSTGGSKGAFISVTENNNSLILKQEDSGNHYAEVNLRGGNKTVDITQRGSGNHMTSTTLTGLPTELSLTQSGSTQQFYSINFNCATAGGCAKITVTQGQ